MTNTEVLTLGVKIVVAILGFVGAWLTHSPRGSGLSKLGVRIVGLLSTKEITDIAIAAAGGSVARRVMAAAKLQELMAKINITLSDAEADSIVGWIVKEYKELDKLIEKKAKA
jgi:hypothetical protein